MSDAKNRKAYQVFAYIRDYFWEESGVAWIESGAAEIGPTFEEVWTSEGLEEEILQIAKDMVREGVEGRQAIRKFVIAALEDVEWCSIARRVLGTNHDC